MNKINCRFMLLGLGFWLISCQPTELSEQDDSRVPLLAMNYTVTQTNLVSNGATEEAPTINKEKVHLRIYDETHFEMRVDIRDSDVRSFHKSELVPGNDYPTASYYLMHPGGYTLYDTQSKIIHQNDMPDMDFSEVVEYLKLIGSTTNISGRFTGGILLSTLGFAPKNTDVQFRKEDHEYGEDYDLLIETYTDELDGKQYTQETLVLKEDQTMQMVSLFDSQGNTVASTAFRYKDVDGELMLANTHETFFRTGTDGIYRMYTTLSEYENFTIDVNFNK